MCQRSNPGSPSTIQSAMTFPTPPAPDTPWAQKPQANQRPATPGASPRMNSPSGVNDSSPLTGPDQRRVHQGGNPSAGGREQRVESRAGRMEAPWDCPTREWHPPRSGAGSRSYPPRTRPVPSCRKYTSPSGSRRLAIGRGFVEAGDRPGGRVLVLHRKQGNRDPRHPADPGRPDARGRHDDVGRDRARRWSPATASRPRATLRPVTLRVDWTRAPAASAPARRARGQDGGPRRPVSWGGTVRQALRRGSSGESGAAPRRARSAPPRGRPPRANPSWRRSSSSRSAVVARRMLPTSKKPGCSSSRRLR